MKSIILFILSIAGALNLVAQSGAPVDVSGYPSSISQASKFLDYDGNGNTIFVCYARPTAANSASPGYTFSYSVTAGTLTSVVVATNVGTVTTVAAHGLSIGNKVVLSGSTTSALNGTYYVQSTPSGTTFTITTSGVSDGTYNNSALTASGSVPLLNGNIWSIEKLTYNTSNQVIRIQWAGGTPGNYVFNCNNRAVTTGATAIYYQ